MALGCQYDGPDQTRGGIGQFVRRHADAFVKGETIPLLKYLKIAGLRNLGEQRLDLHPVMNVISGENGSGKTSLLEAIYLLGSGKSFRAHKVDKLIAYGQTEVGVFGLVAKESGALLELGIVKEKGKPGLSQVGGRRGEGQGRLAQELPILAITPESHELIEDGPEVRRRYLDWGVFHVEHGYLTHWQRYMRSLKQRNALLKDSPGAGQGDEERLWRQGIAQEGEAVNDARMAYVSALQGPFAQLLRELCPQYEGTALVLARGWSEGATLEGALEKSLERDLKLQSTQVGPHRADVLIRDERGPLFERVSRGQQKLLVYALRLAQIQLMIVRTGIRPVVLLDDLAAELDSNNLARVLALLEGFGSQVLITAIEADAFAGKIQGPSKLFHVKQGCVDLVA